MFKGIVKLSKNGKGSLLVSEDLSFKLSRKELFKVFPGDKVECSVQQDKATIQKIIERNTTEVIGKLKKTNKGWIAESVNNEFHLEIVIRKNTSKKLKNGDFCKIKIKSKNINEHLNTTSYSRLKFGVGSNFFKGQQAHYVLSPFDNVEIDNILDLKKKAVEIIKSYISIGPERTMSIYNGR